MIMHWIVFQLVILALSISVSSSQELNSTLRLTEYGVPFAFVGETITFTCRTEGSNSIGWSSKEYIGVNRVDFASVEPDGTTRPPTESGAVAQLISSDRVNGTVILVSQLRITVQSVYQIASVTCHNIGIDTVDTLSFRMADNTSITCDAPAICPGKKVSCVCITAYSNGLAWSSDQLIGNGGVELAFNFNEPLPARQNASNMNTSAVLSDTSDENGVVVLKSELSFVLLSTSFSIILTCENVDNQNSYSIILPIHKECPTQATTTISADLTTTTDESITTTSTEQPAIQLDHSGLLAVAIVIPTVVFVIALLPVVVVLIIPLHVKYWTTPRKGKCSALTRGKLKGIRPQTKGAVLRPRSKPTQSKSFQKIRIQSDCIIGGDLQKQPPDSDLEVNSTSVHDQYIVQAATTNSFMCMSTESDENHTTTQEQDDEAYGSDQFTPKLDLSITVEPDLETIIESEIEEAVPSISATRGMEGMPVIFTYSPFEFKPPSWFTTDKLKQEILTLEKVVSDLRRQMQQLTQELDEKVKELERKQNELEQQQKAGLRVHIQNTEIDDDNIIGMYPIQESEANKDTSSVEANMAGKGDRLHMAPAGNLNRPSVPHSGFRCLTKV